MEITTVEELKKHIGEFLAFDVKSYHKPYTWIGKLLKVGESPHTPNRTEIYCLPCYSSLVAEVYPTVRPYSGLCGPIKNIFEPYHTNAQDIIRTPTKDELNKYKNYWRKRIILGHN